MMEFIPRWTHASIKDFIKKKLSGMPLIVEGEDDRKPDQAFWCELRIDGPVLLPIGTRGEFEGKVEINLFVTCKRNEQYVHLIQDKIGLAVKVLNQCIPITKMGNTEDDGSFVTVLQLLPDQPVDVSNFGQVDPTLRLQQASIEAHYRMQLFIVDQVAS